MSDTWKPSRLEQAVLLTIRGMKVNPRRGVHDREIIERTSREYPDVYSKQDLQDAITILKGQKYLDIVSHTQKVPAQRDRYTNKITVPARTHRVEMYNLSEKALLYLREVNAEEADAPGIQIFTPDAPYSVRRLFEGLFGNAEHTIDIIDNYIGKRTLDFLLNAKDKGVSIRIMTSDYREKGFEEALLDFQAEYDASFELLTKKGVFHGRMLIIDEKVYLLDHSIKDFGAKPSSIVPVEEPTIQGFCIDMFNKYWSE